MDPNVGWAVEETVDQADAVLDAWDKAHSGEGRKDGAGRHTVPIAAEGSEHLLEGGLAREHHFRLNHELAEGPGTDDESAGLDIDRKMPPGGWDRRLYG